MDPAGGVLKAKAWVERVTPAGGVSNRYGVVDRVAEAPLEATGDEAWLVGGWWPGA